MPRTSDKSEQILEFVSNFIQENGYAPSVREIGAGVGLRSTASVSYHLRALQEKGLLQGGESKGRKRAIATSVRAGQIPVVGVVTAGVPILAVENQEGTMAWEGDPGCFALRVRGDSMINAGILSGAAGYTLQILAQRDAEPTIASLLMSLESVFAVLAGWVILGDALSLRELAGCALMMGGIVLAQLPQKAK